MARNATKIPFFTWRDRADGTRRYFWQPSATLRAQGFALKRLSDDQAIAAGECIAETRRVREAIAARDKPIGTAAVPPAAKPGQSINPASVEAMIRAYKLKDEYLSLSPKSKVEYDTAMGALSHWAGDKPKAAIDADMARTWIKLLATHDLDGNPLAKPRPAFAKSVGRVVRRIFYLDKGAAGRSKSPDQEAANPFARLGLTHKRSNMQDPEQLLWEEAAIEAYVVAADALHLFTIGTAITVDSWLGQRMGDVVDWPLDFDVDIRSRQNKRGRRVILPVMIVPHLKARILAERDRLAARIALTEQVQADMAKNGRKAWPKVNGAVFVPTLPSTRLFVSEATGLPYGVDHFKKKFEMVRAAVIARHPDKPTWATLTFQRLRHTAVTRLAEAGCTDEEIATVTGHAIATVKEILEYYLVRTRKMAVNALMKRMATVDPTEE